MRPNWFGVRFAMFALCVGMRLHAAVAPPEARARFAALLTSDPQKIWAPSLAPRLRLAIRAYEARARLEGGRTYGASVRDYALGGKCAAQIEADMVRASCTKQVDVIREPRGNRPIEGPNGETTPIWQFVCPDGGVIKVKPNGDPSSRYTAFPHASRTLRYPAEVVYRDYRDEVAKISEDGHVIPRGPGDLGPMELVEGWSREAHVPLGPCAAGGSAPGRGESH